MNVAIVGGGPAGASAALWAKRLGLTPTVYERRADIGGQLRDITLPLIDVPGFVRITGLDLAARLKHQLESHKIPIITGREATAFDPDRRALVFADGGEATVDQVIYAPGLKIRRLAVPGAAGLPDYSVSDVKPGRTVLVVGGGDRAVEAALRLAERGHAVTLVHRNARLRARAGLADRLTPSAVRVLSPYEVVAIAPAAGAYRVSLAASGPGAGDTPRTVSADVVLVRIGMDPDVTPGMDPVTDRKSGRGVRLIGDAATASAHRSIVEAFAGGMRAAKDLVMSLETGHNIH